MSEKKHSVFSTRIEKIIFILGIAATVFLTVLACAAYNAWAQNSDGEIRQLLKELDERTAKVIEKIEERKAQMKALKEKMKKLKECKCDREESLFLQILSKIFPKIRLDIFSIPLLDLRQTFRLF
ncbi:hypothetical protein XENTR_v10003572 [Xenopus tropicalis]|nr:hypothetical protein XENTR_v10003572 [Xenopus tropicalis]